MILCQSNEEDHQLGRVAHCDVEQGSERIPQATCDIFGCSADYNCQLYSLLAMLLNRPERGIYRYDSERIQHEVNDRVDFEEADRDPNWNEDKQDIDAFGAY